MKRVSRARKGEDIVTRIRMALETHLYQMLKRDDFIVAYWKIIFQVPAEVRERHKKMPKAYGQFWQKLIEEGQRTGALRADLNPNMVRLLLVGSTIYTLMWYDEEGPLSIEEITEVLIEMFLNGMRPRATDTPAGLAQAMVRTLAASAAAEPEMGSKRSRAAAKPAARKPAKAAPPKPAAKANPAAEAKPATPHKSAGKPKKAAPAQGR